MLNMKVVMSIVGPHLQMTALATVSTFNSLASIIAQQIGGVILDRSSYEFLYFILFYGCNFGICLFDFFSHLPPGDETPNFLIKYLIIENLFIFNNKL